MKDNIGIAKRNPSWDMIRSAARTAEADGFITHFDKGYDTMVG